MNKNSVLLDQNFIFYVHISLIYTIKQILLLHAKVGEQTTIKFISNICKYNYAMLAGVLINSFFLNICVCKRKRRKKSMRKIRY